MAKRELNVWLAFADVAFVLFVCALGAMATARSEAIRSKDAAARSAKLAKEATVREAAAQTEITKLSRRLDEIQRRGRFGCADVDPLLTGLSMCINTRLGRADAVKRDNCSITISEDLLRFDFGSATPTDIGGARRLAACVCDSIDGFQGRHPDAFNAIDTIHIDGFTDCVGTSADNIELGTRRGVTLFRLVTSQRNGQNPPWFSKIAVRSFGEGRPTPNSPCPAEVRFSDDRRVRFAVAMRLSPASDSAASAPQ